MFAALIAPDEQLIINADFIHGIKLAGNIITLWFDGDEEPYEVEYQSVEDAGEAYEDFRNQMGLGEPPSS